MTEGVGAYEAEDIRRIVGKILRDLGDPEPPLRLADVRTLLELDLGYYSSANTTLLQDVAHRMKVAGKQVLSRPMLLVEAITKSKLSALWVPDNKRILIDETVPKPKHRWIEGHEVGHSIIPWHREFLFGDNGFTLDPQCHATVEAEANFASSQLLFFQGRFAAEARDVALTFKEIDALAKRYQNTITTTFWRMIEDREPDRPVFGMLTAHPHHLNHPKLGRDADGKEIRHFIRSPAFRQQFASLTAESGYAFVRKHASPARGGPVIEVVERLVDQNGVACDFQLTGFCNGYGIMTIGALIERDRRLIQIAASGGG